MTAGLITAVIGGAVYVLASHENPIIDRISQLGKYAFAVGLLAWLFGH